MAFINKKHVSNVKGCFDALRLTWNNHIQKSEVDSIRIIEQNKIIYVMHQIDQIIEKCTI